MSIRVAALAILVWGYAPAIASAGPPQWGDPARHALVALRCRAGVIDRGAGSRMGDALAHKIFHSYDATDWFETRPFLVREGSSRLIPSKKRGDVFVFVKLDPGRYRLVQVMAVASKSRLPGEGSENDNDTVTLWYDVAEPAVPLVVGVTAGEVVYLGDLRVVDNSYPREGWLIESAQPLQWELRLSHQDGLEALGILAKAQHGTGWVPGLDRAVQSMSALTTPDTVIRW